MNDDPVGSWFGLRVFITPDHPRMELGPPLTWEDFVTPEVRIATNRWLLEKFGVFNTVDDGAYLLAFGNLVYMNPRTCASLLAQTKSRGSGRTE